MDAPVYKINYSDILASAIGRVGRPRQRQRQRKGRERCREGELKTSGKRRKLSVITRKTGMFSSRRKLGETEAEKWRINEEEDRTSGWSKRSLKLATER